VPDVLIDVMDSSEAVPLAEADQCVVHNLGGCCSPSTADEPRWLSRPCQRGESSECLLKDLLLAILHIGRRPREESPGPTSVDRYDEIGKQMSKYLRSGDQGRIVLNSSDAVDELPDRVGDLFEIEARILETDAFEPAELVGMARKLVTKLVQWQEFRRATPDSPGPKRKAERAKELIVDNCLRDAAEFETAIDRPPMVLVLAVTSKRDGRVVGGCVLIKVLGEIH